MVTPVPLRFCWWGVVLKIHIVKHKNKLIYWISVSRNKHTHVR